MSYVSKSWEASSTSHLGSKLASMMRNMIMIPIFAMQKCDDSCRLDFVGERRRLARIVNLP